MSESSIEPGADSEASAAVTADPDGDPGNLNPRDTRNVQEYDGDPDADPDSMNPPGDG